MLLTSVSIEAPEFQQRALGEFGCPAESYAQRLSLPIRAPEGGIRWARILGLNRTICYCQNIIVISDGRLGAKGPTSDVIIPSYFQASVFSMRASKAVLAPIPCMIVD